MILSLNWLSQFINLEGLDEATIIDKIIKAGFEVEEITHLGSGTNLVVGKILKCEDHPDSDHLHVTKVDVGDEVLQIVCGAPNCREGLTVIVALNGAELPGGTIKKTTIRGQESNGMICSLLELGIPKEILSNDSPSLNGIEELDESFKPGDQNILKALGYGDTLLDLSIYANRPDGLAMFSLAKEMGAILDRKCTVPISEDSSDLGKESHFQLSSTTPNCPHFILKVVHSLKIGPSPRWIVDILKSHGIKSINNIVDISNLVMLETGQPMHFYDLRSNPAYEITVRDDYCGDYEALDGITYHIEKGDLMITSEGKPIGIAGIMGGNNTKILDDTSSIIIECALFDAAQIRRTSNRLGLQTEAAMRYAKGLDPLAQEKAVNRAVELLIKYADAKDFEKTVIYGSDHYQPISVDETLEHLNALLGETFTMEEVVSILKRLDFDPEVHGDTITSHIPSYRTDITLREDIDEEIIRLSGFDALPTTLPLMPQTIGKLSPRQQMRRVIEDYLTNRGLNEILTYTLTSQKAEKLTTWPLGERIVLASPLSDARKYIRNGLLASMLECWNYNDDHYNTDINLFELSSVYARGDKQEERLGILLSGNLNASPILKNATPTSFYVLKGLIIDLLDTLGFQKARIKVLKNDKDIEHFHPYQSAVLTLDKKMIGIFGTLHPSLTKDRKNTSLYYLEMSIEPLLEAHPYKIKALNVNRYPSVERDLSVMIKDDIPSEDLIKTIQKSGGELLKSVTIFDIYRDEKMEAHERSITFKLIYESAEKTLRIEDIQPLQDKILKDLADKYQAVLR